MLFLESKPSVVKTREVKPKKAKKTAPEVVMIDEESLQVIYLYY